MDPYAKPKERKVGARRPKIAQVVAAVSVAAFVLTTATFYFTEYQTNVYTTAFAERFSPQLEKELPKANALAVKLNTPLLVSPELNLGYMYTLWYLKVPTTTFDKANPTPLSHNFGRYHFNTVGTANWPKYVLLNPKVSAYGALPVPCPHPQIIDNSQYWLLRVCTK